MNKCREPRGRLLKRLEPFGLLLFPLVSATEWFKKLNMKKTIAFLKDIHKLCIS